MNNLSSSSTHIAYVRNIDADHKVIIYEKSIIEKGDQKNLNIIEKDLSYISLIKYVTFNGKE